MAEYVTTGDLASYLQVDEVPNAELVVELANGLVTDLIGDLDPAPARLRAIALEAAARGYRNPQAYTSVTVGIDDYDKTTRREGKQVDRFGVYLTDEETAELLGFLGVRRRRVGSIRLSVPDVS